MILKDDADSNCRRLSISHARYICYVIPIISSALLSRSFPRTFTVIQE